MDERHLSLRAKPAYWGGKPHLDGVDIVFLAEGEMDSGVEPFLRGEIDCLEAGSSRRSTGSSAIRTPASTASRSSTSRSSGWA
jgi:hypothetical protein